MIIYFHEVIILQNIFLAKKSTYFSCKQEYQFWVLKRENLHISAYFKIFHMRSLSQKKALYGYTILCVATKASMLVWFSGREVKRQFIMDTFLIEFISFFCRFTFRFALFHSFLCRLLIEFFFWLLVQLRKKRLNSKVGEGYRLKKLKLRAQRLRGPCACSILFYKKREKKKEKKTEKRWRRKKNYLYEIFFTMWSDVTWSVIFF